MDELVPPVVTTKPARGREMQTTTIPTDMFDTMRMMAAKKTIGGQDMSPDLQKPTDGTAEYYHEGYVDGKLYLVPDTNLEAMRDIINFKMRPRRSTRYKHQTSYELSDYDHFRGKLDGLFTKLENIEELSSNLSDDSRKEPDKINRKQDEKYKKKLESRSEEEPEDKYADDKDKEYKFENEDSEDQSEEEGQSEEEDQSEVEDKSESGKSKEDLKQRSFVKFAEDSDVHHLRFLVSGHLKKNQKPIYIVQEYNGEPNIFKNQKADFFSKQKDGDIDVLISGKFYNENMLEESDGKPVALKTKPIKIKIETENSKIYFDYFKDIYNMKNVDISFTGEFIKNKVTNRITPFITLGVERRALGQKLMKRPENKRRDQNTFNKNISSTTVLVYKPMYSVNPFSLDEEYINNEKIKESATKEYLHPKKVNEHPSETDAPLGDTSSQQVATHFFSLSQMGDDFVAKRIVEEPINKPFDHQHQPSSNQKYMLGNKEPINSDPIPGETLNTQNTTHSKKPLKEGLLKTLLKGSSFLKTLFEKKSSNNSLNIEKKTQKMNVESIQSIKNVHNTQTTEKNPLENKDENTTKKRIRSIFDRFKYRREQQEENEQKDI